MALNDFTGQNIQDTYKKLVQTEGNLFADGTGSILQIITSDQTSSMTVATASFAISASYALSASHEITYELSSSHAETADALTPGRKNFSGEFLVNGTITASGKIVGDIIQGGSYFSDTSYAIGTTEVLKLENEVILLPGHVQTEGRLVIGEGHHITASGNISASIIKGRELRAQGTDENAKIALYDNDSNSIAVLTRAGSGGNAHIGKLVLKENSTAKVNIIATGNSYIAGTNSRLGIGTDNPAEVLEVVGNISASGNIIGLEISADGRIKSNNRVGIYNTVNTNFVANSTHPTEIDGTNIELNAPVTASGNISASGDLTVSNINGTINGGNF